LGATLVDERPIEIHELVHIGIVRSTPFLRHFRGIIPANVARMKVNTMAA
jgi:hypothetical protein